MQKIADGEAYKMPATIDDPAILDEIGDALARDRLRQTARLSRARRRARGFRLRPAALADAAAIAGDPARGLRRL